MLERFSWSNNHLIENEKMLIKNGIIILTLIIIFFICIKNIPFMEFLKKTFIEWIMRTIIIILKSLIL